MQGQKGSKVALWMESEEKEALKKRATETAKVFPGWTVSHQIRAEIRFARQNKFSPIPPHSQRPKKRAS